MLCYSHTFLMGVFCLLSVFHFICFLLENKSQCISREGSLCSLLFPTGVTFIKKHSALGNLLLEFICFWLLPLLMQARVLGLLSSPCRPGAFCVPTACLQPQLCARASFGVGKVWAAGLLAVRRAQLLATGSWSRSAGGLGESHGVEPTAKTCRSPVGTHFSCLVSLVLLIVGFLNGGRMLSVLPGFWQRFSAFVFYSPSHILASVAIYNTHLRSLYSQQKMTFARLETNTIFFFF